MRTMANGGGLETKKRGRSVSTLLGGCVAVGILLVLLGTLGCEASDDSATYGAAEGEGEGEGEGAAAEGGQGTGSGAQAGLLTAGDWDDNLNFGFYLDYLSSYLQRAGQTARFDPSDRVVITVVDADGQPVPGARVQVVQEEATLLDALVGTDGRVLFFPGEDGATDGQPLSVVIEPPAGSANPDSVTHSGLVADEDWLLSVAAADARLPDILDLAFVIDATGSMSDELEYLKAEVRAISERIRSRARPDLTSRFGLVVYRDLGDDYVTRSFPFTTDLEQFLVDLGHQSAGGGGDYPEAMHAAMSEALQLQWSSESAARVLFLVADAPPHSGDAPAFLAAADQARRLGIRIYPVGASGVADEAEYLLRVASQMTLGRYVFLTDDSGLGAPHAEPHIPCYQVQLLQVVLARMLLGELTGTRYEADPDEVIRTVGQPEDGTCTLDDGQKVHF